MVFGCLKAAVHAAGSVRNSALLAAIAVVKAVNKYKGVQASIKWLTTFYWTVKKLVGILTEMSAEFGRINYIVIGTGINVNVPKEMVPEELRATAVSLADVAREPISRVELLADVLGYMEELYEKFCMKVLNRCLRNGKNILRL